MVEQRRKAAAFAAELGGAYPSAQVTKETLGAYAAAFTDVGLDIADDVSALIRLRSTFPPSVSQIYEAAREVRKETSSEWSTWDCTYVDGIACPNCSRMGEVIVHGHLIPPTTTAHGFHHAHLLIAGDESHRAGAFDPEHCDCGYVPETA